jgi:hypothetical protein
MGIQDQVGLDDLDGILGLSPDFPQNGPSFIARMKESGMISQKVASFFIGHLNQQSRVQFGGFDTTYLN